MKIQEYEQTRNLSYERLHRLAALSAGMQDMLRRAMATSAAAHRRNLTIRAAREAVSLFDEHDVLLTPSTIGEVPAGLEKTGDPMFCRVWTLLAFSCVHLPFAREARGLPVGLQAVERFGAERETLVVAKWMQERLSFSA